MLAMTNIDSVLDDIFKEKGFQLYSNIERSDVSGKLALMDFLKECKAAKDKLVRKYKTSDKWGKMRCDLETGNMYVILVKEVTFWRKSIERRMHRTPRLRSPYRIDFTTRVPEEIVCAVEDLLTCEMSTMYGLDIHLTKRLIEIRIWSKKRLELFFKDLICRELPQKEINKCNVELIVTKEKMFTLRYRKATETLNVSCFYGLWNEYFAPQHF